MNILEAMRLVIIVGVVLGCLGLVFVIMLIRKDK